MIEFMQRSQGKLVGIEASGTLTDADYTEVLIPRLEALVERHGTIRLLFHMTPRFRGWEPMAALDDARLGLAHRSDFERIAVVGGPAWVEACVGLFGFLMKGPVRTFGEGELAEAWAWLEDEIRPQERS